MLKIMAVNAITQYIEDNLEVSPINIDTLVEYSGYSRRYLQILFKKCIGMPVGRYIQLRRITRAAVLLRLSNLSLVSISERLFYDSQQTFTREFKKHSGFTPLQYRNGNIWSFQNMTGHRDVGSMFPRPKLLHMEERSFYGEKLCYEEQIPLGSSEISPQWSRVEKLLSMSDEPLYISHKFELRSTKGNMSVNAVFWDLNKTQGEQWKTNAGTYAYFSFTGDVTSYIRFMYNIYMNSLPFYNLHKMDAFDLEIISKTSQGEYFFEYYIPVTD
ncbi:helix-turn-helix domain-containing protein [Salmonella enterica]|nr:helix-turn-helix domain-containing protein [Salmonella enterica]